MPTKSVFCVIALSLLVGCARPNISDEAMTCVSYGCVNPDCANQPQDRDEKRAEYEAFHPVGHVVWTKEVWVKEGDGPWYHVHCNNGHVTSYEVDLKHHE